MGFLNWICEECGYEIACRADSQPLECPSCGAAVPLKKRQAGAWTEEENQTKTWLDGKTKEEPGAQAMREGQLEPEEGDLQEGGPGSDMEILRERNGEAGTGPRHGVRPREKGNSLERAYGRTGADLRIVWIALLFAAVLAAVFAIWFFGKKDAKGAEPGHIADIAAGKEGEFAERATDAPFFAGKDYEAEVG